MALKTLAAALSLIAAASPVPAAIHDPAAPTGAPAGGPGTLYCMHIEAVTGSRLEEVKCWTRAEWAERGVDVDKDWAREGVSVIG
jgi:hypothetical protein